MILKPCLHPTLVRENQKRNMFMSTRYRKRPEDSEKNHLLFTVDDSIAKLFEHLTVEFRFVIFV